MTGEIPFSFEDMQWQDVSTVMTIERRSFSLPWSASTYRHELLDNANAHYFVLRYRAAPLGQPSGWWSRMVHRESAAPIVGFGGFWLIMDEGHISTIAIDPDWRGRGLGEYLLASMIGRAMALKAATLTLEVRESNRVAQGLYRKYGFAITGSRPRYYQDNQENALLMTVDGVNTEAYQQVFRRRMAGLIERLTQMDERPLRGKLVRRQG